MYIHQVHACIHVYSIHTYIPCITMTHKSLYASTAYMQLSKYDHVTCISLSVSMQQDDVKSFCYTHTPACISYRKCVTKMKFVQKQKGHMTVDADIRKGLRMCKYTMLIKRMQSLQLLRMMQIPGTLSHDDTWLHHQHIHTTASSGKQLINSVIA